MAANTITLKGQFVREEALAAEAGIYPGHLVELSSAGKVLLNNAGTSCEKAFAIEDALQGETVDDSYTSGQPVQYNIFAPGAHVLARVANGEDVSIGDVLYSNGDGTLKKEDSSMNYPIAVALEACDMSDSSGADPSGKCKVRIV